MFTAIYVRTKTTYRVTYRELDELQFPSFYRLVLCKFKLSINPMAAKLCFYLVLKLNLNIFHCLRNLKDIAYWNIKISKVTKISRPSKYYLLLQLYLGWIQHISFSIFIYFILKYPFLVITRCKYEKINENVLIIFILLYSIIITSIIIHHDVLHIYSCVFLCYLIALTRCIRQNIHPL